jgi:hypothetical protein
MFKKAMLVAAAAALSAGMAHAQDSTFGTTSQDTVTINATVEPVVRISGLADSYTFNIGAAFLNSGNPNITQRPDFCIYSNVTSAGTFKISAQGVDATGGNSNAWALVNTLDGTQLPFNINVASGALSNQVGPGDNFTQNAAARFGTRPNTADCSDTGLNTQLVIAFDRNNVLASNAGSYTGTITLVASAI